MLGKVATTLVAALLCACSSVGGSAVPTGSLRLPPRFGAIAVYAVGAPRSGAELGLVEVHASQSEANIEVLVPLFVKKVAALGGNAAVIDDVRIRFDLVPRPHTETFSYACGWRAMCVGTRTYWVTDEVMALSISGRAFLAQREGAP